MNLSKSSRAHGAWFWLHETTETFDITELIWDGPLNFRVETKEYFKIRNLSGVRSLVD